MAKPFVKWAGGKTKLLPELLAHVPQNIDSYFEPMVGGGALFFHLATNQRFNAAWLADANQELVRLYMMVRSSPKAVYAAVQDLVQGYPPTDEASYYAVRALRPRAAVMRTARFLYLNKTCFNGLYRVNSAGDFNVPFGRYKNPTICTLDALLEAAKALRHTSLQHGNLLESQQVLAATKNDFVYIDPPYIPLSQTSNFCNYTSTGFGLVQQQRLAELFFTLAKRTNVVLSNSDTVLTRQLYAGARFVEVRAPRAINCRGDKRGFVGELIILPR